MAYVTNNHSGALDARRPGRYESYEAWCHDGAMADPDGLDRLQQWYFSHCDGDWEHGKGIHISTLDNPGWRVKIPLRDTELADRPFGRLEIDRSEDDWLHCWVADLMFEVACGPLNLTEALGIFLKWAEVPAP
jgi:hypothetical protein